MARGPSLTVAEGYSIRAMLEDGLTTKQIAQHLRRTEGVVKRYIDTNLANTVALLQNEEERIPKDVQEAIIDKLLASGLKEMDAVSAVKIAKTKLTENVTMDKVDSVVRWCLNKHVNIRKLFGTETKGRQKGVAVMSNAASETLDELKKNRVPKNVDDHIWRQEHAS